MPWTCGVCGHQNDDGKFCNNCGVPQDDSPAPAATEAKEAESGADTPSVPAADMTESAPAAPASAPVKKSKAPLIILLVVGVVLLGMCILGILAAILVPRLMTSGDRAKQAKAMSDISLIGAACERYKVDKGRYPETGYNEGAYYSIVDASDLKKFLDPDYLKDVPVQDPWKDTYSYGVSEDGSECIIICNGSDGEDKLEKIPKSPQGTSCFEDEIVMENGEFVQKPEGPQKHCK